MAVTESFSQTSQAFEGIYEVPEAARYIRASTYSDSVYVANSRKLYRWLRRGVSTLEIGKEPGADIFLSFEDLVSMRVIVALRQAGVTWSTIDQAVQWLQEKTGVRRPFATEVLWAGQGEIFTDWPKGLVSTGQYGQIALDFLQEHLKLVDDMVFSESSHMAVSWEPRVGIVLEPQIQFGTPCIKGTRIPTRTLSGMVEAGDSTEWVAEAFGIFQDQVQTACDWERCLQTA